MTEAAPTSKACTKCGMVKLLGEFHKDKSKKDGISYWCKECLLAKDSEYRAKNIEKIRDRKIKYRADNLKKVKEAQAKSSKQHSERAKAASIKWRTENPERAANQVKKWRVENPEKLIAIRAKRVAELHDTYVAERCGTKASQAPPEILAIKREAIAMYRISKQIKQFINPKKAAP